MCFRLGAEGVYPELRLLYGHGVYIRGGTLGEFIRARGMLPYQEALQITIQLADTLAYAHRTGVIHRDIKPVNILFTDDEHKHPVLLLWRRNAELAHAGEVVLRTFDI